MAVAAAKFLRVSLLDQGDERLCGASQGGIAF
jgi:hypothetical protein